MRGEGLLNDWLKDREGMVFSLYFKHLKQDVIAVPIAIGTAIFLKISPPCFENHSKNAILLQPQTLTTAVVPANR